MINKQKQKVVVLSFGRLNPITSGHAKLVDKIKSVAQDEGAKAHLYLSHSQDKAKNPLTYDEKYKYARLAFGAVVQKSRSRTIIDVLKELDRKFDKVIIVVGSDRTSEFETLLNKYNGRDYTYDSIEVVSAGERDPDADDISGMSASKMRKLAAQGDYDSFVKGLPRKLQPKGTSQEIFNTIRSRMGITEKMSLQEAVNLFEVMTLQQRRKRKITMRRIKNKIVRGRKIAQRKLAPPDKLITRAKRKAKQTIRKRVAGQRGEKYQELSPSQKIQIDKQVEKRKGLIAKLAKRLLPKVRKAERERLQTYRQRKASNEEVNLVSQLSTMIDSIERYKLSENLHLNLQKKSERYGVPLEELKHAYINYKQTYQNEQVTFQSLNSLLANRNQSINEAIEYHTENGIPFHENVFRMYSDNYFQLFREARKLYSKGVLKLSSADEELINTDIGDFAIYEENGRRERVPLDCPMVSEEDGKDVELNKPKRGGPKKFYVYVKDPTTGNVKKVSFGDTTGLTVKLDDKEAAKSFAARHQCSQKKDKTKPGYWACRLPRYAKQLGLSGGGSHFW